VDCAHVQCNPHAVVIGPGIARELARQRELSIVRETERARAERVRVERSTSSAELLPSITILVGVLLLAALGAPLP
jgi:hypothetical protein